MFSIFVIKILFLFFLGIIATKFIEFLSGDKEGNNSAGKNPAKLTRKPQPKK